MRTLFFGLLLFTGVACQCHHTHTLEVKARSLFHSVELRYSCSFDPETPKPNGNGD